MGTGTPDVDALVAELRARVEERRSQGAYPPGLEHDLSEQARLLLSRRVHLRRAIDVSGPLARVDDALPLSPGRITPGPGSAVDRLVAGTLERHVEALLGQLQAFAAPVDEALTALATAVEELQAQVEFLRPPVQAVIERQAVEERGAAQAGTRAPTG